MTLDYQDPLNPYLFQDVNDLLIHYIKRQKNEISFQNMHRTKLFLRQEFADLLGYEREPMSDEEEDSTKLSSEETHLGQSTMICNRHWYLFFRLHHLVCRRMTEIFKVVQTKLLKALDEEEEVKVSDVQALSNGIECKFF